MILLTRFCKLLTRVATPSEGGTCLKCLNGTTVLLLNDLSTFLTIADVIQLKSSYTACLQFNKREIKQPATFSKPLCERIFIHKILWRKPSCISVPNGTWYERSMVRTVHGTNSLVIPCTHNVKRQLIATIAMLTRLILSFPLKIPAQRLLMGSMVQMG